MSGETGINRELNFGEVISKTFELYRNNFVTYLILFLIVEALFAVITAVVNQAANLPSLGPNPTAQQISDFVSSSLGTLLAAGLALVITAVVVFPIAAGTAVRIASEEVQGRKSSMTASASFAASKLLSMWALGIIVGLLVFVGLILLVIPGIILAIMFCLVLQALLIENAGVIGSLTRSRELVSHRWLKTFAIAIVLGIIIIIISAVLSIIAAPFGSASGFVSTVLGAFTAPIIPIATTVYYYSNLARISPPAGPMMAGAAAPMPQPGMKFCPNCGTEMVSSATFCPKCGAKQPV